MAATNFLPATIAVDISLAAGVYSANSLTTAASTTLTLDGGGLAKQFWVFNINDSFTMGASSKTVLIGGAANNSIIWNTGGFTSLGADSLLLGTLLSNSYISIGANTSIFGNGASCGGAFSALSSLFLVANSVIGKSGCRGVDNGFRLNNRNEAVFIGSQNEPIPEPQTWVLFLIGVSVVGFAARRKQSIPSVC